MKSASAKPAPGHHRCLYLSATGRKCRSWALDPRAMFCHRHFEAQPHGPDDFAFHLLNHACNFQNALGIHDSTRRLYTLLAAGAISPRRAAVLGYLTSLLLRTLPAVYKDPCPEAGTPMSAAQLAEREQAKAKSLAAPASSPPAQLLTQKPTPAGKAAPALEPVPPQKPVLTHKAVLPNKIVPPHSAQPTPQPSTAPAPPTYHRRRCRAASRSRLNWRSPQQRRRPPHASHPRRICRPGPQILDFNSTDPNSTYLNETNHTRHHPS